MHDHPMENQRKDRRGTWPQALREIIFSLLIILTLRWALFEPYVIPSGSMIPTLLVHDHILVNKFAYGLRLPFTSFYIWRWAAPHVGDIVVFRSLENSEVFLIKRVLGVGGDQLVVEDSGYVTRNGEKLELSSLSSEDMEIWYSAWPENEKNEHGAGTQLERIGTIKHLIKFSSSSEKTGESKQYSVKPEHFFAMGDHRDRSSDSRVFGEVSIDRILGRASLIWLSCETTLPESPNVCDPTQLRFWRIFRWVR